MRKFNRKNNSWHFVPHKFSLKKMTAKSMKIFIIVKYFVQQANCLLFFNNLLYFLYIQSFYALSNYNKSLFYIHWNWKFLYQPLIYFVTNLWLLIIHAVLFFYSKLILFPLYIIYYLTVFYLPIIIFINVLRTIIYLLNYVKILYSIRGNVKSLKSARNL